LGEGEREAPVAAADIEHAAAGKRLGKLAHECVLERIGDAPQAARPPAFVSRGQVF